MFAKWTPWADLILWVVSYFRDEKVSYRVYSTFAIYHSLKRENTICLIELIIYLPRDAIQLWIKYLKHYDGYHQWHDQLCENYWQTSTNPSLPLTPLNKISIVQLYVFNKLRWRLSIHHLTETWVDKNIDKVISKFVRKWC